MRHKRETTALPLRPAGKWEGLVLLGLPLVLLLPFLTKAVNIDDAFFLAIADHITHDPLHPYDFHYNWTGHLDYVWNEMKNPPFIFYFQAFILRFLGRSELVLHTVFLVYPLAASLAMAALARRVVRRPLYPTFLLIACPAFLVSASSLMMDVPVLAFYLLAVVSFVAGAEQDRAAPRIAAGLAAALAVLTKYFALSLIPLLAAYALLHRKNLARNLSVLLLPAAAFAAWHLYGEIFHGGGHLWKAMSYRSGEHLRWAHILRQLTATLTFTGGLLVVPILCLGTLRTRADNAVAVAVATGASLGLLLMARDTLGFSSSWQNQALFVLLAAGSILFLIRAIGDTLGRHDPLGWLLRLWFWGGLLFCLAFNWTVNARTVVLFAPPALLLFARWTEVSPWRRRCALILTLALGLLVTLADDNLAEFGRREAALVSKRSGKERVYFIGHWGFQYYMEQAGYEHVDFRNPPPRRGGRLVVPTMHLIANRPLRELFLPGRPIATYQCRSRLPLLVMNREAGAGLHGSFLGILPFAYSHRPLEVVRVYRW
jgi:hypothetical protein